MTLNVNSSYPYEVVIENSYKELPNKLKAVLKSNKVFIITDDNVASLPIYTEVLSILDNLKLKYEKAVFPHGESMKNAETCFKIEELLINYSISRNDTVIAFGGGVVGDLVGFASSIYMRGIQFIQIPTTLLAMVDSSIGGKTAIDFKGTKNLIGTFHSPSLVFININALKTLPMREINSGMGEVLKYAFLSNNIDKSYLNYNVIHNNDTKVMDLILNCLKIKKEIIENDEFENGKRALLNLGHTIGHAIEALSDFKESHGECVVKGLKKVIDISKQYYSFGDDVYNQMLDMIEYSGILCDYDYPKEEIVKKILHDKKANCDGINFILLKDIGMPRIVKLTLMEINKYLWLQQYLNQI